MEVRIPITDWTHTARGVGRMPDGRVAFVSGALPGEEVSARVVREEKRLLHAEMTACHRPSPERQAPPCPLFGACGGCEAQHRAYEGVLAWKQQRIVSALERIGGVAAGSYELDPAVAMDPPWRTRNKAEYAVSGAAVGFKKAGTHEVIDAPDCLLQHSISVALASAIRQGGGFGLEGLTVRVSRAGEALAQVHGGGAVDRAIKALMDAGASGVAHGNRLVAGEPLTETCASLRYELPPGAFWQVNHRGFDALVDTVLSYAALSGGEKVLDAYCGAGAFSLPLARRASWVLGIERFAPAVESARHNAAINGIGNAEFIAGDVERVLPERDEAFDCAVVDPPRKGCHPLALAALAAAPRIVYVSCDPATLARDVKALGEHGFRLVRARAVDMFPWTGHVETVVLLAK